MKSRSFVNRLGLIAVLIGLAGWPAGAAVIFQDGFGDGDRNNDGVLDHPDGSGNGDVDDAGDVGVPWWLVGRDSGTTQAIDVAHDLAPPAGLGDDNALAADISGPQGYQIANFAPVSLVNPGDQIKVTVDVRFTNVPTNRDTFRFGLFNSGAHVVNADQTDNSLVAEDVGYFATVATGSSPDPTQQRARIAENGPGTTAGSLFGIDRSLVLEEPSQHVINDTNPHTMSLAIIHTHGGRTFVKFVLDGVTALQGEDPVGPVYTFNEVGFGSVPTPELDYIIDNVVVESGTAPVCESIGTVTVGAPLPIGATTVVVNGVGAAAEEVRVYANDTTLIGTAAGSPPATPASVAVTVTPLVADDVITAYQIVGGEQTCIPGTVGVIVGNCEDVPEVALVLGFETNDTSVQVVGVSPDAESVQVYANGTTVIGSVVGSPPNTPSELVVPVTPLVAGDLISVTQIVNGVEGCMPVGLPVRSGLLILVDEDFGDGDRDNNGTLDNPDNSGTGAVDDAGNTGAAWYKITMGNHTLRVDHDAAAPAGLGDDNALFIDADLTQAYQVANFDAITLATIGDYIEMTFEFRLINYPSYRDILRFGLFNNAGTPILADQPVNTDVADDAGYFAALPTGIGPAGNQDGRIARAGPPNTAGGTLFGVDQTLDGLDPFPYLTDDTNPHTAGLRILKVADDRVEVTLSYDGNVVITADHTSNATADAVFTYNQVGFGEVVPSGQTPLDYVLDKITVVASISACEDPVFDTNGNGVVNMADLVQFELCGTGPAPDPAAFNELSAVCHCVDVNKDKAIDMRDFAVFQRCYSGTSPADAACDD